MKKTLNTILITTLILIIILLTFRCYYNESVGEKHQDESPVTISDTLVRVVYDTIILEHYKVVKLPVLPDTLTQTITKTITDTIRDSVFVELPISRYVLDTTITTDSTTLNLSLRNSGYLVELDTLSYSFTYTPKTKRKHRLGVFVGPSLGVTYFNGKILPTVGFSVGFGLSVSKH